VARWVAGKLGDVLAVHAVGAESKWESRRTVLLTCFSHSKRDRRVLMRAGGIADDDDDGVMMVLSP
jgi:hypothetical protein